MRNICPQDLSVRVRRGFTLIELMVVVAIIVILIAILVPAMGHFRSHAIKAGATAQLNAISTGLAQYFSDFNTYPPSNYNSANIQAPVLPLMPAQGRGSAMLAEGLMGYLPYAADGAGSGNTNLGANDPAFGFRTRSGAMGGKIYGPYASDDPKTYKQNAVGKDEAFIDPWGNEILYFRSTRAAGIASPGTAAPPKIFDIAVGNDSYFCTDDCKITFAGIQLPDPSIPLTAGTPAYTAWQQFYLLLSDNPAPNSPGSSTLGSNSFLLISAGEDGTYFTADDIVASKQ